MSTHASTTGPLGHPRGIAFAIVISIITIGLYTLYWIFKTQDEVKEHSGIGVGGVIGLVIYILISTFVVLNLFIAITVSAMEPQVIGEIHEDLERLDEREQRTDTMVLAELRALRAEVEALRARLPDAVAPHRAPAPEPEGKTDALPA